MLLESNLGAKPTWLLGETGNLALEADPRIPPNQKKYGIMIQHKKCPLKHHLNENTHINIFVLKSFNLMAGQFNNYKNIGVEI